MASKSIAKLPVEDIQSNVSSFVPLGTLQGNRPGPTLAVIGGVHGTEYSALDGVARFWQSLDPAAVSGTVLVVLAADVLALTNHSPYLNPTDKKNLNRAWPGKKHGTLTEVIAYTLTETVVNKADVVIDSHGGEWDESIDLFVLTHTSGKKDLDKKTMDLAMAVGMPFVEINDSAVMCSAEAVKSGRPGITLEAGGRGIREERYVTAVFTSLHNAMKHLGMEPGMPVPWAGKPVRVERSVRLTSNNAGLFASEVPVGSWVEADSVLARVFDFDGTVLEEIHAPEAGIVMNIVTAHAIRAGGFAGKLGIV